MDVVIPLLALVVRRLRVNRNLLKKCLAVLVSLIGPLAATVPSVAQDGGHFKGEAIARFLPDGRNVQLVQPFGYVDPSGQNWDVPVGAETDGTTIPRQLWVSYPPFTGQYRLAAIVHDYYCETKTRGWKETHEVFYHAMRTAGVAERQAKVMYAAVYRFGPRWGDDTTARGRPDVLRRLSPEQVQKFLKELEAWVEKARPSLLDIAKRMDAQSRAD
jgi:hypothetical protein